MAEAKKETDLKKVKEIVDMMIENDLVEVEIIDGDNKILLKRPGSVAPAQQVLSQMPMMAPAAAAPAQQAPEVQEDDGLVEITSPMVGTFYTAPSPDSDPYIKTGDSVGEETVVCIIEAMKVMNEIRAETTGTIEKIMVSNGQAIEYGQVLFKVKPN